MAKENRPILIGAAAILLAFSILAWKGTHHASAPLATATPAVVQPQTVTTTAPPMIPVPTAPPPSLPASAPAVTTTPTLTDDQRALLAPVPTTETKETAPVAACQVTLESTPPGIPFQVLASAYETAVAQVLQSGETPAIIPLPPGTYRVVYSPAGMQVRSVSIPVPAGDKATFLQEFPHGKVKVRTQPDGAEVTCDGQDMGPSPLEIDLLPGGHDISAESNGRTSRTRHIQLADAAEQSVSIDFHSSTPSIAHAHRPKPKADDSMLTKIGRSIKTIFTGEKPKKH